MALPGHIQYTVRRYQFNRDSLSDAKMTGVTLHGVVFGKKSHSGMEQVRRRCMPSLFLAEKALSGLPNFTVRRHKFN